MSVYQVRKTPGDTEWFRHDRFGMFIHWGLYALPARHEWVKNHERTPEEVYDGYVQLENGVGMMPLLQSEFEEALEEDERNRDKKAPARGFLSGFRKNSGKKKERKPEKRVISVATGVLAAPLLRKLSAEFLCYHPDTEIHVYAIRNDFFGEKITVSGLLTGQDLKRQLSGKVLGEKLLLPCNLLRSGEEVFLDDMTLQELENALQVPIHIVKSDGKSLYDGFLYGEERKENSNE